MKTAVIVGIIAFMLGDTFLMWCLLRANSLYEQEENEHGEFVDESVKKQTY